LRGDVPAGAFPLLASGISACPPGTGKRGQADGAARHPYHGATPKTATGTGALPSQVPVGGRAPAPANGSLRWTNDVLVGTLRGDVPAGAFPFGQRNFCLPAGDRKARADGRRSAPSLPKPGRPPACRVALPRHTAGANGEDGKRVAAFFILKCGLATRANGRKPAGDESKPQPIKKKYGARECYDH
jgi:hypothetical protein